MLERFKSGRGFLDVGSIPVKESWHGLGTEHTRCCNLPCILLKKISLCILNFNNVDIKSKTD